MGRVLVCSAKCPASPEGDVFRDRSEGKQPPHKPFSRAIRKPWATASSISHRSILMYRRSWASRALAARLPKYDFRRCAMPRD